MIRFVLLMNDSLGDALRANRKEALRFFMPMVGCVSFYLAFTTLPSYNTQRAVLILFVNFAQSNTTLSLMLNNMAGKEFKIFSSSLLLLVVPLFAYHVLGISAAQEGWLTFCLTWCTLGIFIARLSIVARQFCDHAGISLFVIPKDKRL